MQKTPPSRGKAVFCGYSEILLQVFYDILRGNKMFFIGFAHQILIHQKRLHLLVVFTPTIFTMLIFLFFHTITAFRCLYYTILKCIFNVKIDFFGGEGFTK